MIVQLLGVNSDDINIDQNDDGCIVVVSEKTGMRIKITNDNFYFIDKYGNEMSLDDLKLVVHQNAPTYDELYQHWIKTRE